MAIVTTSTDTKVVRVKSLGPQGPVGPQGPRGLTGTVSSSTGLTVTGSGLFTQHVTASGNITGSSTSTGSFAKIITKNIQGTSPLNLEGEITASSTLKVGSYLFVDSHITASGNISGSATSTGSFGRIEVTSASFSRLTTPTINITDNTQGIQIANTKAIFLEGGDLKFGNALVDTEVDGANILLDANSDINLDAGGGQINMKDSGTTYFTFNVDSTPEIDIVGDLIIDPSGGNTKFNSHITASGDISASDGFFFGKRYSTRNGIAIGDFGDAITFGNINNVTLINGSSIQFGLTAIHITSSGNISSSYRSTASFGKLETTGDVSASGNISTSGNITLGNQLFGLSGSGQSSLEILSIATPNTSSAKLTIAGNISASGQIEGITNLYATGIISSSYQATSSLGTLKIGSHLGIGITPTFDTLQNAINTKLLVDGAISASGHLALKKGKGIYYGTTPFILRSTDANAGNTLQFSDGGALVFFTGSASSTAERSVFTISKSGNIGIGDFGSYLNVVNGGMSPVPNRLTVSGSTFLKGTVTASGQISSSEAVYAKQYFINQPGYGNQNALNINASNQLTIGNTNLDYNLLLTNTVVAGNLTTSAGDVITRNITSSGTISGSHISASGNIRAVGNISASNIVITGKKNGGGGSGSFEHVATTDISASGIIYGVSGSFRHITASHNISTKAYYVNAGQIDGVTSQVATFQPVTNTTIIGDSNHKTDIVGTQINLAPFSASAGADIDKFYITASGNISASGMISASGLRIVGFSGTASIDISNRYSHSLFTKGIKAHYVSASKIVGQFAGNISASQIIQPFEDLTVTDDLGIGNRVHDKEDNTNAIQFGTNEQRFFIGGVKQFEIGNKEVNVYYPLTASNHINAAGYAITGSTLYASNNAKIDNQLNVGNYYGLGDGVEIKASGYITASGGISASSISAKDIYLGYGGRINAVDQDGNLNNALVINSADGLMTLGNVNLTTTFIFGETIDIGAGSSKTLVRGSLSASGHISASHIIGHQKLTLEVPAGSGGNSGSMRSGVVDVRGSISASGTGSFRDIVLDRSLYIKNVSGSPSTDTAVVNVDDSANIIFGDINNGSTIAGSSIILLPNAGSTYIQSHITASGRISASGAITASGLYIAGPDSDNSRIFIPSYAPGGFQTFGLQPDHTDPRLIFEKNSRRSLLGNKRYNSSVWLELETNNEGVSGTALGSGLIITGSEISSGDSSGATAKPRLWLGATGSNGQYEVFAVRSNIGDADIGTLRFGISSYGEVTASGNVSSSFRSTGSFGHLLARNDIQSKDGVLLLGNVGDDIDAKIYYAQENLPSTHIQFNNSEFAIKMGGGAVFDMDGTNIRINPNGFDRDFIVRGDNFNLIKTDAGNDRVHINPDSENVDFQINNDNGTLAMYSDASANIVTFASKVTASVGLRANELQNHGNFFNVGSHFHVQGTSTYPVFGSIGASFPASNPLGETRLRGISVTGSILPWMPAEDYLAPASTANADGTVPLIPGFCDLGSAMTWWRRAYIGEIFVGADSIHFVSASMSSSLETRTSSSIGLREINLLKEGKSLATGSIRGITEATRIKALFSRADVNTFVQLATASKQEFVVSGSKLLDLSGTTKKIDIGIDDSTTSITGSLLQYTGSKFETDTTTFEANTTNFIVTGSTTISGSTITLNGGNIYTTGSFNVSGKSNLVGNLFVTGALMVTESATFVGLVMASGSTTISGSLNVISGEACLENTCITGSLGVSGSAEFTGSVAFSNTPTIPTLVYTSTGSFTGSYADPTSTIAAVIGPGTVNYSDNPTGFAGFGTCGDNRLYPITSYNNLPSEYVATDPNTVGPSYFNYQKLFYQTNPSKSGGPSSNRFHFQNFAEKSASLAVFNGAYSASVPFTSLELGSISNINPGSVTPGTKGFGSTIIFTQNNSNMCRHFNARLAGVSTVATGSGSITFEVSLDGKESSFTEIMRVKNTGLGIGTISPTHNLHVSQSGTNDPVKIENLQAGGTKFVTIDDNGILKTANAGTLTASGSVVVTGSLTVTGTGSFGALTFTGTTSYSGSLLPATDKTYDLGSTSKQWKNGHITSASLAWIYPKPGVNLQVSGAVTFMNSVTFSTSTVSMTSASIQYLSASSPITIGAALVPDQDNVHNLGSSTLEYKDLYLDGVGYIDALGAAAEDTSIAYIKQLSGSSAKPAMTSSVHIVPGNPNKYNLGSSVLQWRDLYIQNVAYIDNLGAAAGDTALAFISHLTGSSAKPGLTASVHFVPGTDNLYDLGSQYLEWKDLYIDGTAYIDTFDNVNTTHITASGNISASYTSTGSFGRLETNTISVASFSTLNVTGHITASSISASTGITGSNLYIDGTTTLGNKVSDTHLFVGHVTASSYNISASGLIANTLSEGDTTKGLTLTGNITASNNISASGDLEIRNITSSGDILAINISASGDIFAKTGSFDFIKTDKFINHQGDSNTTIELATDDINFNAGGKEFLNINELTTNSRFEINREKQDINFHYHSVNTTDFIKFDAALDSIQINGPITASKDLKFSAGSTIIGNKREVIKKATDLHAQVSSSGALLVRSHSAATTLFLPPVADSAGVQFTIITGDNNAHIISQSVASAEGGKIYGNISFVSGGNDLITAGGSGSIGVSAKQKITLSGTNGIGQKFDFVGDGTNWYVTGIANHAPTLA